MATDVQYVYYFENECYQDFDWKITEMHTEWLMEGKMLLIFVLQGKFWLLMLVYMATVSKHF